MSRSIYVFIFSLLFFGSAFAAYFSEVEYKSSFSDFTKKFNKQYVVDEYSMRYGIFKANLDLITKHNADSNSGFTLGVNQFADLTLSEFNSMYKGLTVNHVPTSTGVNIEIPPQYSTTCTGAPTSCNWVNQGAVTGIKNQGQCGSCWSFSTTGSTEGGHFLSTGSLVSLSEQNLMDCSGSYGNEGCNGGLMDDAFQYIIANGGIDTEASYPYTAVQGTCHYSSSNSGAAISAYKDIPSGSESGLQSATNGNPVSVAIDASHPSFQLYTSGVYYEPACSTTALDHGVLVVGYGVSNGVDYWLVKNSWGTTWGMAGYIMMSRNRNNNCGIATMASYPVAK